MLSLKLVFDRESGKPKGYGFCEYKDQETALSAMRNLNGYEIGGRTLRVDNACTEKSRMEMAALLSGPQVENPYGEICESEQAPEVISKTVASLPPEQMYELMKQMKTCIQNNPQEARTMLLQNPQLTYALLQAQVVMRIVDPVTAVSFMYKPNQMPPVLTSQSTSQSVQQAMMNQVAPPVQQPAIPSAFGQDTDLRSVDPRLNRGNNVPNIAPSGGGGGMDMDMRMMPNQMGMDMNYQRNAPAPAPVNPPRPAFQSDPRQRPNDSRQQDPRQDSRQDPRQQQQQQQQQHQQQQQQKPSSSSITAQLHRGGSIIPTDASDQEKAALIMQVLKLTDEQISILPPEQRASILVLKDQIAKSTKTSAF